MVRSVLLFLLSFRREAGVSREVSSGVYAGRPASRLAARVVQHARLRRLVAVIAAFVLGTALTACSPTYDWRSISNDDSGYTVDLPAKPGNDERQIDVGGVPMKMRMQTAEADDTVFAVGTVLLPSDDPQLQRNVLEYLRNGLARNLGATPNSRATQIPLAMGGQVLGIEMDFSGKAGPKQEQRTIHARIVAKGTHVYQAAVIADKEPPPDQLDQFFESFKLY